MTSKIADLNRKAALSDQATMCRVLFLSDGSDIAVSCARSVACRPIDVLGIVVGPNVTGVKADAILRCFKRPPPLIQTARPDLDPQVIAWVKEDGVDLLLSIFFEYRIRPFLLKAAKLGGINIHPSALPHNGGFHSSFWGILEQTPLGATLMRLEEGLDTGGIIAQKTFKDDGIMTAAEVRARQRQMCAELFEENIDRVIAGDISAKNGQSCSYHFKRDIAVATTFSEDDQLTMERLMRLGRATAHGQNGLTIQSRTGDRFRMRITLSRLPT
jgi:methionyl-tRNA formyltransferase